MGIVGRSGRKRERFCKRGHDKDAPHGAYLRITRGYVYAICGVCRRAAEKARRSK